MSLTDPPMEGILGGQHFKTKMLNMTTFFVHAGWTDKTPMLKMWNYPASLNIVRISNRTRTLHSAGITQYVKEAASQTKNVG